MLLASGLLAVGLISCAPAEARLTSPTGAPVTTSPTPAPPLPAALDAAAVARLPAAVYDAVIPGLLAAPADPKPTTAYRLDADTAVYGADFATPVARIPATDFLDEPTVVVPVETQGDWSLVLTASRQTLPSQADAPAPAQTTAWLPTAALRDGWQLTSLVTVAVAEQTLTISNASGGDIRSFSVGVGAPETPTPTNVTGYIQARYLDPAQNQTVHRIQLTSLHATGADEPYRGSDGGLIGIHYQSTVTGAISHGCIRLSSDAITAVDKLPLGTPVRIVD